MMADAIDESAGCAEGFGVAVAVGLGVAAAFLTGLGVAFAAALGDAFGAAEALAEAEGVAAGALAVSVGVAFGSAVSDEIEISILLSMLSWTLMMDASDCSGTIAVESDKAAVSSEYPYMVAVNIINKTKRADAPVIITFFIMLLLSNILQSADI